MNEDVQKNCHSTLEQHEAAHVQFLKEEAERAEARKKREQLEWDKQVCRKSLVNDLKYPTKIANEAIDAVGTDVEACVAWIKEKQQRDKAAKEEKERLRKEKKAMDESDEEEESYDSDESYDGGRVWTSSDEEDEEDDDMGTDSLTRVVSMAPVKVESLLEERMAKIVEAQKVLCVSTTIVANLLPHYR